MPPPSRLRNVTMGETLTETAFLLTSFCGRFLGMLSPGLPLLAVVGLAPCDWIHTVGLRRPLDVAYCDVSGHVLKLTLGVRPNRFERRVRGAYTIWEAPAGSFAGRVSPGDVLLMDVLHQSPGSAV